MTIGEIRIRISPFFLLYREKGDIMSLRLPRNFIQIDPILTQQIQTEMRAKIMSNLQHDEVQQEVRKHALILQGYMKQIESMANFNSHWSKMVKSLDTARSNYLALGIEKKLQTFDMVIGKIYQEIQEILGILRGQKISYAVYLELDGKVERIHIEDIPINNFKINSRGNLLFNFSKNEFEDLKKARNNLSIAEHYANFFEFIQATYWYQKKTPLPNRYYNRGVIAEAFENDLTPNEDEHNTNHNWNVITVWSWLNDAADDTTAWYVQGDVGDVQVKNITAGALRVASMSSIQNLASILVKFVSMNSNDINLITNELIDEMIITNRKKHVGDRIGGMCIDKLEKMGENLP